MSLRLLLSFDPHYDDDGNDDDNDDDDDDVDGRHPRDLIPSKRF